MNMESSVLEAVLISSSSLISLELVFFRAEAVKNVDALHHVSLVVGYDRYLFFSVPGWR